MAIQASAAHEFPERVLNVGTDGIPTKAARYYQQGQAVIKAGASVPAERTIRPERRLIVATLKRCDGHRATAAEKLGIGLRTLSGKLREYGYAPREKDFANAD